ncbi:MAG: START domain-containing protein [Reichenbachiella sp.]
MKKFSLFIIVYCLSLSLFAQDWELEADKENIKVYTRKLEVYPVKEFKAEVVFPISYEKLKLAVEDFENYKHWYDHCEDARLLKRNEDGSSVSVIEVEMPFPFKNRDMVSRLTKEESADEIVISFKQVTGILEPREKYVRMPVAIGKWKLTRLENNKTAVIHQFVGDPAGNIPTSIVNMFIVDGPMNTLSQLRDYIENQ